MTTEMTLLINRFVNIPATVVKCCQICSHYGSVHSSMSTVSISDLGPLIGKVAVDVFFSWAQRLRSLCEYEERRESGGGLPGHLHKKHLTFMQPDKKQQFPVVKNVGFPWIS